MNYEYIPVLVIASRYSFFIPRSSMKDLTKIFKFKLLKAAFFKVLSFKRIKFEYCLSSDPFVSELSNMRKTSGWK